MRTALRLLPIFLLSACVGDSGPVKVYDTGPGDSSGWPAPVLHPKDDLLRLDHLQALGTHNSYHLIPDPLLSDEWAYSHEPLDVQADMGVRQFELDARFVPNPELPGGGRFEVYHVPVVDEETTCLALTDCLSLLASWSRSHPGHMPLMVMLEPKSEGSPTAFADYIEVFEEEIQASWPRERLFTPADLQGEHESPAAAIAAEGGWPHLRHLRGKLILVLLDRGPERDVYSSDLSSLEGRSAFLVGEPGHPLITVALPDDPIGEADELEAALQARMLVRTRADSGGDEPRAGDTTQLEAALASGAQFVSTDFPAPVEGVPYVAEIPGGTPARCNPVLAPAGCRPEDIEDPALLDGQ